MHPLDKSQIKVPVVKTVNEVFCSRVQLPLEIDEILFLQLCINLIGFCQELIKRKDTSQPLFYKLRVGCLGGVAPQRQFLIADGSPLSHHNSALCTTFNTKLTLNQHVFTSVACRITKRTRASQKVGQRNGTKLISILPMPRECFPHSSHITCLSSDWLVQLTDGAVITVGLFL